MLDVPTCLCWLAAGSLRLGDRERAARQLDEARQVIEATGQSYFAAELERLGGALSLSGRTADRSAARERFLAAAATARRQGARLLELRATVSLARLLRKQRRNEDARQTLREILAWFTEGFETADLTYAKNLLAELS